VLAHLSEGDSDVSESRVFVIFRGRVSFFWQEYHFSGEDCIFALNRFALFRDHFAFFFTTLPIISTKLYFT
jgi:hypothetical protein